VPVVIELNNNEKKKTEKTTKIEKIKER